MGIEKMNAGLLAPKHSPDSTYIHSLDCDPQYEDTLTSLATNDSEVTKEHSDKDWTLAITD